MKWLFLGLGIITGLMFSRIPHYLDIYETHSLPPEYEGPKIRSWHNGVVVIGEDWTVGDEG